MTTPGSAPGTVPEIASEVTPKVRLRTASGVNAELDPVIFDDLFHACALQTFVAESSLTGDWPDPERTRRRAYELYESALAEANADRTAMSAVMLVDAA